MSDLKHVSFSGLKIWNECPFKFKLLYKDKLEGFKGNEYTAFGTAIHTACELMVEAKYKDNAVFTTEDAKFAFKKDFLKNLQELRDKDVELKSNMISDMLGQAKDIIPHIMPSLEEYFGKFRI